MKKQLLRNNVIFTFFMASLLVPAVCVSAQMEVDNIHVRVWNKFADDTLTLHKKLTQGKNIDVQKRIGSYAHEKNFYIENRYFNKGKLISQVQWEKDSPTTLHTIEVYVRDDKGRVIRDFMAAYLPFYHNAPTQTLVSIHHYKAGLHAFRSFDASGEIVLERCEGTDTKGQRVNLLLDDNDLIYDPDNIMSSKEYKACFAGLKQKTLGKYIIPQ